MLITALLVCSGCCGRGWSRRITGVVGICSGDIRDDVKDYLGCSR